MEIQIRLPNKCKILPNIPTKEATLAKGIDEVTPMLRSRGEHQKKRMTTSPSTKLKLHTPRFSQEDKGKAESPVDLTGNNSPQVTEPHPNVTTNNSKVLFKKMKFGATNQTTLTQAWKDIDISPEETKYDYCVGLGKNLEAHLHLENGQFSQKETECQCEGC